MESGRKPTPSRPTAQAALSDQEGDGFDGSTSRELAPFFIVQAEDRRSKQHEQRQEPRDLPLSTWSACTENRSPTVRVVTDRGLTRTSSSLSVRK